jgi:histidine triad (HIT) family protein
MSDCLFCRIVEGAIPADKVYEDEQAVVFKDINPKAEVHLLVVPRAHIASLNDVGDAEAHTLTHLLRLLPRLAQQQGLEEGFRTIINTGKGAGQEVFHLHIHLLGGDKLPGF